MSENSLGCHSLEEGRACYLHLVAREVKDAANYPVGHPATIKNYPTTNVSSAEVEKSCIALFF